MEKLEVKLIRPIYIRSRYGFHEFIPFTNVWDGLGDEELKPDQQEFLIPESYYRCIGEDYEFPESVDLDGGPFMSIGSIIEDFVKPKAYTYKIDKFDCRGKYPIIICSKLSS